MEKLIKVELRDPKGNYIECVNSISSKDYQIIYVHYKKKSEWLENNTDKISYRNYEEFKNDRDILEDILNKKGQ